MKKIFSKVRVGFITLFLSFPSFVLLNAQSTIDNPLKSSYGTIPLLIAGIVDQLIVVAGVVAVMFLLYSGFLFVKAAGNEKEIEDAKKTFFYTIIGIAILLGARVISSIVQTTISNVANIPK